MYKKIILNDEWYKNAIIEKIAKDYISDADENNKYLIVTFETIEKEKIY